MQMHTRLHARQRVAGGKSLSTACCDALSLKERNPSVEAGWVEVFLNKCQCAESTHQARGATHIYSRIRVSQVLLMHQKKSCSFLLHTCRTKFRTCDLTVKAAAGGRINIVTVATTTRGCGDFFFFFLVSGQILQGVAQV